MISERRMKRAERVLKMFARRGRIYRNEFREKINILIAMQNKDNEEWRARHRAMDEKINILINTQIDTNEQIDRLAAGQAKTDEALRHFINSLNKNRNGNSEN